MMLQRINEVYPSQRLREEMDQLFEGFFGNGRLRVSVPALGRQAFPSFNVWEDDKNFFAEAEVPGLKMEELAVSVMGNELAVEGERKDAELEGVTYHRRERGVGSFSRVLRLPVEIDTDKVEATLCDGVLTVRLPKAEAAMPKKIEVKS